MTEASNSKPPARARLGTLVAALLGCTALLLLGSGTWDARVPTLRSYRFAALGRGQHWAGGSGSGERAGAAASAPLPTCELDVEQGPIAESCHLLTDVCVDQVSHGGWQRAGRCQGDAWTVSRMQTPPGGCPCKTGMPATKQPRNRFSQVAICIGPHPPTAPVQQMAVLYGREYHPPPGATRAPVELPLLEPSHRHSHYVLQHKDTVR